MKVERYLYLFYTAAIAACLAWAVSGWLDYKASEPVVIKKSKVSRRNVVTEPDYSLIISKNIMDIKSESVEPEKVENKPVSDSFEGRLTGVMHGSGNSFAVVIYKEKTYVLREGVEQDGLILVETGYFHAVISVDGARYKIFLEKGSGQKPLKSLKQVSDKTSDTINKRVKRRDVVEKLSDVNSIIKSVFISPFERKGKFLGYRIARMNSGSVLRKIGVEPGDVIIRLNGRRLENPTVFFDALSNAENLNAVTLDIERRGKRKTIYVEIEG